MACALKASVVFTSKAAAPQRRSRAGAVRPVAAIRDDLARYSKAAGIGAASLALALAANAAEVKLGGDDGSLVFVPSELTIKAGETVTWKNNRGFPHNVMFDEDAVPAGVNADALSHEDYLNGPGESVSSTFTKPGVYEYYCQPHSGSMQGKITVTE